VVESSGKGAVEWKWDEMRPGCQLLRFVGKFEQGTARIVVGNRQIGLQDLLANPESLGREMQREQRRINRPWMRRTSSLAD